MKKKYYREKVKKQEEIGMQHTIINESRYTLDEMLEMLKGAVVSEIFKAYEKLKWTDSYENLATKWDNKLKEKEQQLTYKKAILEEGKKYNREQMLLNQFHKVDVFNEIILVRIQKDLEYDLSSCIKGLCNLNDIEFGTNYCVNVIESYIENKLSTRIAYIGEELSHCYGESISDDIDELLITNIEGVYNEELFTEKSITNDDDETESLNENAYSHEEFQKTLDAYAKGMGYSSVTYRILD
jgi:hypothetical protein